MKEEERKNGRKEGRKEGEINEREPARVLARARCPTVRAGRAGPVQCLFRTPSEQLGHACSGTPNGSRSIHAPCWPRLGIGTWYDCVLLLFSTPT